MIIVKSSLLYLVLVYISWIFYLAIMSLKMANDYGKLSKPIKILAYPILIFGYILDFILNTLSSVVFFELPRELLLTARCDRHLKDSGGWRKKLSIIVCRYLLDPFQIGGHCSSNNSEVILRKILYKLHVVLLCLFLSTNFRPIVFSNLLVYEDVSETKELYLAS